MKGPAPRLSAAQPFVVRTMTIPPRRLRAYSLDELRTNIISAAPRSGGKNKVAMVQPITENLLLEYQQSWIQQTF